MGGGSAWGFGGRGSFGTEAIQNQMQQGFDNQNTASINANTTAQVQKVLDAITENKVDALRGRINQLELNNAVAGVVRYPTTFSYNAGQSPFCGGCGYNGAF